MLLSLDASSTKVGLTIWDKETPVYMDKIIFPKISLLERADYFADYLNKLLEKYFITEMVIEEAFTAMYGGSSSAQTTATLNQINFGIQYICYKKGLKVNVITVNDARTFSFPDYKKNKANQKEQYFHLGKNEIEKDYPGLIVFETKTISRGPRKGEVEYEEWCGDVVDSYIVGKGYLTLSLLNK